ncbi:MAG TPA: hypothetical protein VGG57_21785 [Stellaceae bacterium]|jgi:hypothetical protein
MTARRVLGAAAALCLIAAQPPPFYLGTWQIIAVEPAAWTHGYYEEDKLDALKKFVGEAVVFKPGSVEGPPPIACPEAQYTMSGVTASTMFDGGLVNRILTDDKTAADDTDPSGGYISAQRLAEKLGFRGFSWKSLGTGCATPENHAIEVDFATPDRAVFAVEDFIVSIRRK